MSAERITAIYRVETPLELERAAAVLAGEQSSGTFVDVPGETQELRNRFRARLALIFITHNLGIVAKMCDQLAVMYAGRVVEYGPVSRIFNAPAHPYTEALLNSIPRMTDSRQRLTAIEGQPPDLSALSPGCSFAPRCPRAMARCREAAPPETDLGDGRTARCWLAAPALYQAPLAAAVGD
jgi:oligopeptide/dipeptide ABC transporter ATP-binding protein